MVWVPLTGCGLASCLPAVRQRCWRAAACSHRSTQVTLTRPSPPIWVQAALPGDPLRSSLDFLHNAARTAGQPPAPDGEAAAAAAAEERLHKELLARAHFARWVLGPGAARAWSVRSTSWRG